MTPLTGHNKAHRPYASCEARSQSSRRLLRAIVNGDRKDRSSMRSRSAHDHSRPPCSALTEVLSLSSTSVFHSATTPPARMAVVRRQSRHVRDVRSNRCDGDGQPTRHRHHEAAAIGHKPITAMPGTTIALSLCGRRVLDHDAGGMSARRLSLAIRGGCSPRQIPRFRGSRGVAADGGSTYRLQVG